MFQFGPGCITWLSLGGIPSDETLLPLLYDSFDLVSLGCHSVGFPQLKVSSLS